MQVPGEAKGGDGRETGQPAIKPMFDDAQMRKLRIAVVGMGAVLLLGLATVIGRIVYLFNRAPVDPAIVAAVNTKAGPGADPRLPASERTLPPELRLALPAGAVVRNLSLAGNRLAVHYEAPSGTAIAIIDLATGQTTQKVEIVPGK